MIEMELFCDRKNPPIAALLAFKMGIEKKNSVNVVWGSEMKLRLPNGKIIYYQSCNDLLRIFANEFKGSDICGKNAMEKIIIDYWISFSLIMQTDLIEMLKYLDGALNNLTYLAANKLTTADLSVFAALHGSPSYTSLVKKVTFKNVSRWMKLISSLTDVSDVLSSLNDNSNNQKDVEKSSVRNQEGKFIDLPGAEVGKVVVRFPPEASGYLHIGHAKAALLNQYYQQAFNGKLIMRFDDTNPAKENVHFEKVILGDIALLDIKPDLFTHTSEYFDLMIDMCEKLIVNNKAFVDDTLPEIMKSEREQKIDSKNRNNSVDENLKLWNEMKIGSEIGIKCCVRAKIDMQSPNGCMRDPTIYRCKSESHPRTGTKYKVYPTYDFACPIVDAIENVTHVLRTMEYHDRDAQFYWFIDALGLRKPYIWEYSRLNMTNTVLSKRKLTWFVESGLVDGWDDPRFPTVRGILRRGMTVEGLKEFIIAQGSSRSVVFMEWDKIWAFNKKVIDSKAPRYTALISSPSPVPVNIKNITKYDKLDVPCHPKNPDVGMKSVWIGPKVLIDQVDAKVLKEGENTTFINWGNIKIEKIIRSEDGNVTSIDANANLSDKDYKKTVKITWLADAPQISFIPTYCVYFDHIISKAILGKDEDFKQYIDHNTRVEFAMIGDPELAKLKKGDIIQLQRRGYFIVDVPYEKASEISGCVQPCILFNIPDGHTKEILPSTKENEVSSTVTSSVSSQPSTNTTETLNESIIKQGDKIRDLKAQKCDKSVIQPEVQILLELKKQYKSLTGTEWTPKTMNNLTSENKVVKDKITKEENSTAASDTKSDDLVIAINKQGNVVRELKANKAEKKDIDAAVKILLELKTKYKQETGVDFATVQNQKLSSNPTKEKASNNAKEKPSNTKEKSSNVKEKQTAKKAPVAVQQNVQNESNTNILKKQTRLGIEARKEESLSDWYSQVITKGEMIEYYDISGCYILRPWAYNIWDTIREYLTTEFRKRGVKDCYFPIFVSKAALEREKTHIADFSPEVAWVTRSGESDLAEPIAIRPTSETIMYPAYAKWIQSYRDLPMRLNQWNNVVRWEFQHPQPFIRTREFLWQEGHTAFASKKDADHEVRDILDLYACVYTDLLAIPVIKGHKTEKEKFAGGDYTTTVEAFVAASGRGIQGGTSHHLGQNFSKMFEIVYEDPDTKEKQYVFQNSWGITTRTIGVMVMVHGDNQGLVLPPRVAAIQVIIVPCGITATTSPNDRQNLLDKCAQLENELGKSEIRVQGDFRDNYSPGWKFNHWELKGVPLRVECGPKDLSNNQLVVVRRDTNEKITIKRADAVSEITKLLDKIQKEMLGRATAERDAHLKKIFKWEDFKPALDGKNIILAPYCGDKNCEEAIKRDSATVEVENGTADEKATAAGAKALCIPFEQPKDALPKKCIYPDCKSKPQYFALFGRSY